MAIRKLKPYEVKGLTPEIILMEKINCIIDELNKIKDTSIDKTKLIRDDICMIPNCGKISSAYHVLCKDHK